MTAALSGSPAAGAGTSFHDGAFVCIFGKSGSGKTTDLIASFPLSMVCAGTREFKPALTVLGWHPPFVEVVHTLFELEDKIDGFLALRKQRNPAALSVNAVIADDFTVMSFHTEQALKQPGGVKHKGATIAPDLKNYSAMWTAVRAIVLEITFRMSEKLKQEGLHFGINGHQRQGRVNNAGKPYRGGIDLPMDLTEALCAGTNMTAMVIEERERLFLPTLFDVTNNGQSWATKNQFGLPPTVPSNTREILVSAGYRLLRPPGMEIHEEYVENLCGWVYSCFAGGGAWTKENLKKVLAGPCAQLATVVKDPRYFQWIVRDAVDRATLRLLKSRNVFAEVGL